MVSERDTVYIVDDDDAIRDSLALLLGTVGIDAQSFASGDDLLNAVSAESRGCILLDIRMPGMSGMETQQHLNVRGCQLPVIFLTGHGDVPMAVEALQNGAHDFIQKPFRDQELLDVIQRALESDQAKAEQRIKRAQTGDRYASLTAREKEVMAHVVRGEANKVIAIDLALSQRTVEVHRSRVMEKMGARSLADLVRMALILESPAE